MEIKSAEEYIQKLKMMNEAYRWPIERYEKQLPLLEKAKQEFPHTLTVYADYEEHDIICHFLWETIGPRNGKCIEDFCHLHPSCPIFLPIREKYLISINNDGDIEDEPDVPEHYHQGLWTSVWMMKTGYDIGYETYCFINEKDKEKLERYIKEQKHAGMSP